MMKFQLSDAQLRLIHSAQLEMLDEVDRVCRRHNIRYMISGGTLLGAVRNKGFIPWDDDIDIRMERNEYNRFCEICQGEIDSARFFFQTYRTDKGYPWFYAKMRYNHSKYVRNGQEHLKMHDGIFIDIMPADGVPNTAAGQKRLSKICFVLKKVLYSAVGCRSAGSAVERFGYRLLNLIPKAVVFHLFERIARRYSNPKYKYVTCYSFVKWNQEEYTRRSWHLELKEYEFEGKKYYSTCAADEWLTMTYGGDYMELPPMEKRRGHNDIAWFSINERDGGK